VDKCPISSPKLNDLIETLNRLSAEHRLPMSLRGLEAFADDRDESLWMTLAAPALDFEQEPLTELLRTEVSGVLSLQYHELSTKRRITDGLGWNYWHAGAHRWRIGHQSFFQVNRHMTGKVLERITHELEGTVALDLYAGVGLFTRALAEKFSRVTAVEGSHFAAPDLKANTAELDGVKVRASAVEEYLADFPEECDVALLDPPRAGLGKSVVDGLLELGAPRLLYLSCDPSTLARDLSRLVPRYRITGMELFDLFPQTFHIETLVRLEREG
jgi:23S rRNA (uracil1939-C5)-methyltransferase